MIRGNKEEVLVCLGEVFFLYLFCLGKSNFFWSFCLDWIMVFFCVVNCFWSDFKLFCWGWISCDIFKSLFCSCGICKRFEGIWLLFFVERGFWVVLDLVESNEVNESCFNWGMNEEKLVCLEDVFFWVFWLKWRVFFFVFSYFWCFFKLFCRGSICCENFVSFFWNFGILEWFKGSVLLFLIDINFWNLSDLVIRDRDEEVLVCLEEVFFFNLFCSRINFWVFCLVLSIIFCMYDCFWSVVKFFCCGRLCCGKLRDLFCNVGIIKRFEGIIFFFLDK